MSEPLQPISDGPEDTSPEFPAVRVDETNVESGSTEPYVPLPINEAPVVTEQPLPAPSFWDKLRGWMGSEKLSVRINDLSRAIEMNPESAGNYVLRGELYFQSREYALAQADFQRGLTLAERQLEANDWDFSAQGAQDRAVAGLHRVQRHQAHENAT